MNPYRILGVKKNVTADQIEAAYRKQARAHHPDRGGTDEGMKKLQRAYDILRIPEDRAYYDQTGEEPKERITVSPEDEARGRAINLISSVIVQILNDMIKKDVEARICDMIQSLTTSIQSQMNTKIQEREYFLRVKKELTEVRNRFVGRDMKMVLDYLITANGKSLEFLDGFIQTHREALKIVEKEEYVYDLMATVRPSAATTANIAIGFTMRTV